MTPPVGGPVVVDTGVFSARLLTGSNHLEFAYRPIIDGRPLVISFVTRAELRYGASLGNWGARRLARLDDHLTRVETVWPDERESLVRSYSVLRTWAVRTGHGIGQKDHEADRWIAATAMWLNIPLVAHDSIFKSVEDLQLITLLPD